MFGENTRFSDPWPWQPRYARVYDPHVRWRSLNQGRRILLRVGLFAALPATVLWTTPLATAADTSPLAVASPRVAAAPPGPATATSLVSGRFADTDYWTDSPFVLVQIVPSGVIDYGDTLSSGTVTLRRSDGTVASTGRVSSGYRPYATLALARPEQFNGTLEFDGDAKVSPIAPTAVHVEAVPSTSYSSLTVDSPETGVLLLSWPEGASSTSISVLLADGSRLAPATLDQSTRRATFALMSPAVTATLEFDSNVNRRRGDNPWTLWPDRDVRPVQANGRKSYGLSFDVGDAGEGPNGTTLIQWHMGPGNPVPPGLATVDVSVDGTRFATNLPFTDGSTALPIPSGSHEFRVDLHGAGRWLDASATKIVRTRNSSISLRVVIGTVVSVFVLDDTFHGSFSGTFHAIMPAYEGDFFSKNGIDLTVPGPPVNGHYQVSWTSSSYPYTVEPLDFWVVSGRLQALPPSPPSPGALSVWYQSTGAVPPNDQESRFELDCTRVNGSRLLWFATPTGSGWGWPQIEEGLVGGTCEVSVGRGTYPDAQSISIQVGTEMVTDEARSDLASVRSRRFSVQAGRVTPVIVTVERAEITVYRLNDAASDEANVVRIECQTAEGAAIGSTIVTTPYYRNSFAVNLSTLPQLTRTSECRASLISAPSNADLTARVTRPLAQGSATSTVAGPVSEYVRAGGSIALVSTYTGDVVITLNLSSRSRLGTVMLLCDNSGPKTNLFIRPGQSYVYTGVAAFTDCFADYSVPGTEVTFVDDSSVTTDGRVLVTPRPIGCPRPIAGDATSVTAGCARHVTVTVNDPMAGVPVAPAATSEPRATVPSTPNAPVVPRGPAPSA